MKFNLKFSITFIIFLTISVYFFTGCSNDKSQTKVMANTAQKDASKLIMDNKQKEIVKMELATFAAGCFWGVEVVFRQVIGVTDAVVGYTGGKTRNPTYKEVCTDRTGHAEAVQVTFDPSQVSYEQLLEVFWDNHDPTTLNRQGPDVGSQYRSAIFYHDEEQKAAALASKERLQNSGKYKKNIVTEITPASEFYKAEEYHQRYLEKRGLASCRIK